MHTWDRARKFWVFWLFSLFRYVLIYEAWHFLKAKFSLPLTVFWINLCPWWKHYTYFSTTIYWSICTSGRRKNFADCPSYKLKETIFSHTTASENTNYVFLWLNHLALFLFFLFIYILFACINPYISKVAFTLILCWKCLARHYLYLHAEFVVLKALNGLNSKEPYY